MSDEHEAQGMREADVANGENPDEATPQPATGGSAPKHPTGVEQAQENQENDPPA